MTPERWQQIDALFAAALERAPDERQRWLNDACQGDGALRDAVLELLADAGAAEAALGESVSRYAGAVVARVQADLAREEAAELPLEGRVGPYRLLREVGRGGMGAVYLAERADAQFQKQVALKLVKRGMDTDEVLRRFRYERQILAALEHPNIARLYDGGAAEDGRPYLVMEYVEGEPVTRSCDARRLGIDARLRLFAAVCEAVRFAHGNLVVHRDIKPSNILVGADGRPRLLDFGIARLLDPAASDTPRTRTELRLLTPEYASPEQLAGGHLTTATDVYSLGLVLCELLAGRRPASAAAPERPSAMAGSTEAAALRGTTPERLRRRLRGDLDTIVLRALAEDPAHRYPSAEQLLADVERHLAGLPVAARGDSVRYRAARFVRRNRAAVVGAALVAASLVGGLGAALWQAQNAARERDQARQERARAEQVSGFVLGLFEAADPLGEAGGDTLRVRALVERGAGRVRTELAGEPRLRAQMLTTLGRVYTNLGLYPPAQEMLDEALALAAAPGLARQRADALAGRAEIAARRGEHAAVDSLQRGVLALYQAGRWPPDVGFARSLSQRGAALEMLGRTDEARALHEQALRTMDALEPVRGLQHARLINNLAVHYAGLGDHARAESLMRESLAIERPILGERHPGIAAALNNLASTLQYQGRYDEAEAAYGEAIGIARETLGADHSQLGGFLENLATLLADGGRHAEAEPRYREAVRILTAAFGESNPRLAVLKRNLALNRHSMGDFREAEALLRSAEAVFVAEYGEDHLFTALARASRGRTLTAMGRAREALPLLHAGLRTFQAQLPEGHWRIHAVRGEIGAALAEAGDPARAEPLLLESHARLAEVKGPDDYSTVDARRNLHRFYARRNQPERAAAYADRR
jgi:serine/threonine-protein kinase